MMGQRKRSFSLRLLVIGTLALVNIGCSALEERVEFEEIVRSRKSGLLMTVSSL